MAGNTYSRNKLQTQKGTVQWWAAALFVCIFHEIFCIYEKVDVLN